MAKDFNFQSVYVHAIEDSSATLNLDWGELSASDIIVFACDNTGNVTQYYNWEVSKNDADRTYNLKIFNSDADFTAYVYRRESVSMQWSETANANLSIDAVKKQIEQIVRCVKQIEVQNKSGINAVDSVEGRLPDATKRAKKFLTFDANGEPVADTPVDTLESNRRGAEDAQKNAKYYAQHAEIAKDFAYEAQDKAERAEAYAQKWAIGPNSTTETPDDTNNAKYYAQQADISRQEADEALTYISGKVDEFDKTVESAVTSAKSEIDVYTSASKDAIDEAFYDAEKDFNSLVSTKTNTFNNNARTKHSEIYTLYSNAKRNLDGCVDEAEYALKNAVEIADPEGWRRNTRSMINVLQQTKSNKGEFYFNGGNAEIQNMSMNGSWSLCCRIRMQASQVQYASIFHLGEFYLYWDTRLGVYCSPAISTAKQISADDDNRLANGEWHSLVVSYDGATLKLTDETGVLLSVATSEPISTSGNLLIGEANYNSQIADVKYFNFDMSANDAPYTIADYMVGKEESPLLQTTQPIIDWHNLNGSTRVGSTLTLSTASASYPRLFQNGTFKPNREYSIDILGNVLYVVGQQNVGVRIDLPTSKAILTNKITGEVSEITNSTITLWLGNGTDFDVNVRFVANAENTDNNCFFRLNQSGRADSYFTLSAQSVGALLSLEDYSFNGKIADVSGNNNTATITGAVYGSKDNAVEQMYQAFASRIQNVTME